VRWTSSQKGYRNRLSLLVNSDLVSSDCPQNTGPLSNRGPPGSGANSAPTGTRQWGAPRDSGHWRDRDDGPVTPDVRPKEPDREKYQGGPAIRGDDQRRDRDSRGARDNGGRSMDNYDSRNSRRRSHSPSRSRSPRRSWDGDYGRNDKRRDRSVAQDYREKRRRID